MSLTFDRPLPSLPVDSGVILADPAERGQGTIVENNLVADGFYARGIYIGGVIGATVRNNTILRPFGAAVLVDEDYHPRQFSTGPGERTDVSGNRIENAIAPNRDAATGTLNALGAIQVASIVCAPECRVPASQSNRQIRLIGNTILGSRRAGIW